MANQKNSKFQKNEMVKTCCEEEGSTWGVWENQYGIVLDVIYAGCGQSSYLIYLQSGEKTCFYERYLKKT
jgi:hypothetical protein